ncbi:IS1096 element passenger TnpR family protein [Solibacillus sp. FSL H8-0538]|uniref:IS1096 element passenger TnpR family protein n=1 Tax=Solibacillus sp. FSL H8-0538 TaxID=2921400 RepID=UPI0030F5634A
MSSSNEEQKFLYLFDFGDEWEFSVTVVKITEGREGTHACIRQSKGKSPDQYAWE